MPPTPPSQLIAIHHVGGRGGTGTVALPPNLRDGVRFYFYEADESCVADAVGSLRSQGIDAQILPVFVGETAGRGVFHIMGDASASSLFELNPRYRDWFYQSGGYDFIAADTHRTDRNVEVNRESLDSLCLGNAAKALPPELLSIDAQGAAWQVLAGAQECLRQFTLAIVSEIEFVELYAGQKRYGDVTTLVESHGFEFISFLHLRSAAPVAAPVGWRTMSSHPVGTVLYLRSPDRLPKGLTDQERFLALRKLAFLAILFNQPEFAAKCLRLGRSFATADLAMVSSWLQLTERLDKALQVMESGKSRPRFEAWLKSQTPSAAAQTAPASFFTRRIRPWIDRDPKRRQVYVALRIGLRNCLTALRGAPMNPLERVLEDAGLTTQADALRRS